MAGVSGCSVARARERLRHEPATRVCQQMQARAIRQPLRQEQCIRDRADGKRRMIEAVHAPFVARKDRTDLIRVIEPEPGERSRGCAERSVHEDEERIAIRRGRGHGSEWGAMLLERRQGIGTELIDARVDLAVDLANNVQRHQLRRRVLQGVRERPSDHMDRGDQRAASAARGTTCRGRLRHAAPLQPARDRYLSGRVRFPPRRGDRCVWRGACRCAVSCALRQHQVSRVCGMKDQFRSVSDFQNDDVVPGNGVDCDDLTFAARRRDPDGVLDDASGNAARQRRRDARATRERCGAVNDECDRRGIGGHEAEPIAGKRSPAMDACPSAARWIGCRPCLRSVPGHAPSATGPLRQTRPALHRARRACALTPRRSGRCRASPAPSAGLRFPWSGASLPSRRRSARGHRGLSRR